MNKHSHPAASTANHGSPQSGNTGVERGAAPATLPIGATCEPPPCGLQRAETPTGKAGAPNLPTLCPQCGREAHKCMCPWPGDEDMMPAVDVNRIMGEWKRLREVREAIARDLGSAVVL